MTRNGENNPVTRGRGAAYVGEDGIALGRWPLALRQRRRVDLRVAEPGQDQPALVRATLQLNPVGARALTRKTRSASAASSSYACARNGKGSSFVWRGPQRSAAPPASPPRSSAPPPPTPSGPPAALTWPCSRCWGAQGGIHCRACWRTWRRRRACGRRGRTGPAARPCDQASQRCCLWVGVGVAGTAGGALRTAGPSA